MARYQPLIVGFPGAMKLENEAPEQGQKGILLCPKCTLYTITVNVAAIWLQLGKMPHPGSGLGSVEWQAKQIYMPILASVPEDFDAVRVWRYSSAGQEPQVQVVVS